MATAPPTSGGGTIPGLTGPQSVSVDDAFFIPVGIDVGRPDGRPRIDVYSVKVAVRGQGGRLMVGAGVQVTVTPIGDPSSGVTGADGTVTLSDEFEHEAANRVTVTVSARGYYLQVVEAVFVGQTANLVYNYAASVELQRVPSIDEARKARMSREGYLGGRDAYLRNGKMRTDRDIFDRTRR